MTTTRLMRNLDIRLMAAGFMLMVLGVIVFLSMPSLDETHLDKARATVWTWTIIGFGGILLLWSFLLGRRRSWLVRVCMIGTKIVLYLSIVILPILLSLAA